MTSLTSLPPPAAKGTIKEGSKNPSEAQLTTEVANEQGGLLGDLAKFIKEIGTSNSGLTEFLKKLGSAAGQTAAVRTELVLLTKGYGFYNSVLKEAATVQKELDTTLVDFNKTIGDGAPAALDKAVKAFQDFNFKYGLTGKEINDTFLQINKSFALTGLSSKDVAEQVAQNSKVIGSKEMTDYIKTFALQAQTSMKQTEKSAQKMGEQFVVAARKVGLPNDELLKLSQGLLTSGVAFGRTKEQLEELTIKSEAFGRALGGSGSLIQEQLGSMRTIQGRLTKFANLQRIAAVIGAEVDSRILSSDPVEQEEGLKQTFINISEAYKGITDPAQRNAFGLAFQSGQGLSMTQSQTVLERDFREILAKNEGDLKKALEKAKKAEGISDEDRFAAATTEQQKEALRAKLEQKAAFAQMGVFGEETAAATANLKQMNAAIIGFAKAVNGAGKTISEGIIKASGTQDIVGALEKGDLGGAAAGTLKAGGAVAETIAKAIADAIIKILSGLSIKTSFGEIKLGSTQPQPQSGP